MKPKGKKNALKILVLAYGLLTLAYGLYGCEAFVRKFTRKNKNETLAQEELVLTPEIYKNTASKEEQYRQYFIYWKAEDEELIDGCFILSV